MCVTWLHCYPQHIQSHTSKKLITCCEDVITAHAREKNRERWLNDITSTHSIEIVYMFTVYSYTWAERLIETISVTWHQHIGNNMSNMRIDQHFLNPSVCKWFSLMHTSRSEAKINKWMKCVPVITAVTATRIQEKASVNFLIQCVLETGDSKGIQRAVVLQLRTSYWVYTVEFKEIDHLKRIDILCCMCMCFASHKDRYIAEE